ncbi:MAG TPA: hypothetical protein GXX75_03145 [Clostridiales bacterium]|nr:hypothetical protein [Clostridiales bacterium]
MTKLLTKVNGKVYNISELISDISFEDSLNNGCSKLRFSYIDKNLEITNGSVVSFTFNDTPLFYGYVFSVNRNKNLDISVTAYDQLRYCKVRDSVVIKNDTVTTLTNKMCNYFNLKKGSLEDTGYKLSTDVKEDTTWLDIIYSSIEETERNNGKKYLLRDENGLICIRKLESLQLNLAIGDQSLLRDYTYSKSIDNEFYNQIKLNLKGRSDGDNQYIIKKDADSISKYGLLQYYGDIYNTNSSKAKEEAKTLLEQYNKEKETLSLSCIGDIRIRAGVSFYGKVSDIDFYQRLVVKSVTHRFVPTHTMEVEAKL